MRVLRGRFLLAMLTAASAAARLMRRHRGVAAATRGQGRAVPNVRCWRPHHTTPADAPAARRGVAVAVAAR
jgi:hypothetical protein